MNLTFTWILDKFGLQVKPTFDFPVKPAVKKVAKKAVKIPKATTRTKKTK
jgi:hypothetical protein